MKNLAIWTIFGYMTILGTTAAQAQERAAGGAMETQMTWSALSSQISGVNTKLEGTNSRIDQIVVCGKLGKIYAPGAVGATPQGCVEASSTGGTDLTTIVNTLTTLSNNFTTLNNTVTTNNTKIVNCGKTGAAYNGTTCVLPTAQSCRITSQAGTGGCGYGNEGLFVPTGNNKGSEGASGYCFKLTCN